MKTNGKKPRLAVTPSQTVGPYFTIGLTGKQSISRIAEPNVKGERIKLVCTLFDGRGARVDDGLIEIWQADADGKYNHPADKQAKPVHPGFLGFGRLATENDGVCIFETVKPGRVPSGAKVMQAPHLEVSIFARGVLKRLATRVYFEGDAANAEDPVLALVPRARRNTLMARPVPGEPGTWRIDVHLSGKQETVFFDV